MPDPLDARKPANGAVQSSLPPIGRNLIHTSRGLVDTVEVSGFSTMTISKHGKHISIAILLYQPPEKGEKEGVGMLNQLDAPSAREMAASLLRLADDVEPLRRS